MTQNERILEYLKSGKTLTPLEALEIFGCFRLASRISDLRKEGYPIRVKTIRNSNGKHFAQYSIEYDQEPNGQLKYA